MTSTILVDRMSAHEQGGVVLALLSLRRLVALSGGPYIVLAAATRSAPSSQINTVVRC